MRAAEETFRRSTAIGTTADARQGAIDTHFLFEVVARLLDKERRDRWRDRFIPIAAIVDNLGRSFRRDIGSMSLL